MLVRVKLLGSGTPEDPHRANLPAYKEVLTLVDQGIVYALIPDTEHPDLHEHPSATFEKTGHGDALIGLGPDGYKLWYSHLDDRYQERKGDFRPEIA